MKNESEPFFSVIIPVYNIERYIKKCLNSIVKQSFSNYEVILIDDGSEDSSKEICDEYVQKYSSVFQVQHVVNAGVSSARNLGLSIARGTFIVFVDGDDFVEKKYLEEFYEIISLHKNIDLAICGVSINGKNIVLKGTQEKNGEFDRMRFYRELVDRNSIRGFLCNKSFRRSIIIDNNIFLNTGSHICEDLLFCIEFTTHMRNAYLVNIPYYNYVQRSDSAVHKKINPKYISVLDTYNRIIFILEKYASIETQNIAHANLLLHNVNIFFMFCRQDGYMEVVESARNHIKDNIRYIKQKGIKNKMRVKTIFAYILTIM